MGFVLNSPTRYVLSELLEGENDIPSIPVFCGGPVGTDHLFFLHDIASLPGAVEVSTGLFANGDFDMLLDFLRSDSTAVSYTHLGNDAELAASDIVFRLGKPLRIADTSWIKPGKVAWDWWNAWNLYGVDFRAGINNETYKYYIDFAAENGIEYVILDEGWAVNKKADLMQVVPERCV